MNPIGRVKIKWSPEFAYAIGLITTDGNLSCDGRHINFTSKDENLVSIFKNCLCIDNKISVKTRGNSSKKLYSYVQFGDKIFYKFLLSIGLCPKKSKIIGDLQIPKKYFFDFLRGHFDGDGTFYSYWDTRWRSSFMFYTVFISASEKHIVWLRSKIKDYVSIYGHVTKGGEKTTYQLKYAKKESLKLLKKLYYKSDSVCLERKKVKIQKTLAIIGKKL